MTEIKRRSSFVTLNTLRFEQGRLYGRENEIKSLQQVYRRTVKKVDDSELSSSDESDDGAAAKEMILISGYSGTGKTALAQSLQERVRKRGDMFISGKFDLMKRSTPYAAIVEALFKLPEQLQQNRTSTFLRSKLGLELSKVIVRCVPALKGLLFNVGDLQEGARETSVSEGISDVGGTESKNQFNYAFRSFIRSICEENNKIMVLFIDDLQWADAASLELIEILVTDQENRNLLVMGSYRDNEVDEMHPLTVRIREIETKAVNITHLSIEDLDRHVVNRLISDTLNLVESETEALAEVVHAKTHGNVFFVIHFLKALVSDGMLTFNFGTFKWSWDLGSINGLYVTDNVSDLMLTKMKKLSVEQSQLLSIASCLGSSFDSSLLALVIDYLQDMKKCDSRLPFIDVKADTVESCITEETGYIERANSLGGDAFRFTHDNIQQAAFSLIPPESKGLLQWFIGQALVKQLSSAQLDEVLFGAADLLNTGLSAYISSKNPENDKEILRLAEMNLAAGKKATAISAFRQALAYAQAAIGCIKLVIGDNEDESLWDQHPNLCLEVYLVSAQSSYCIGNFDLMRKTLDIVLNHTKSKDGRLAAYLTLVQAYISREDFAKAIDIMFRALDEIGESIPRKPSALTVVVELLKMKKFMKKYPMSRLNDLPPMNDPQRATVMKLLVGFSTIAYVEYPNFLPLIAFRLVRWSCTYGISSTSPNAFALYGLLMVAALGDFKGGSEYTTFAIDLFDERIEDRSEYSYTKLVATMVKSNLNPLSSCIKDHLVGYQAGMECGDNLSAANNMAFVMTNSFFCGRPLPLVLANMNTYIPSFTQSLGMSYVERLLPNWQLVILLTQKTKDIKANLTTCELNGELMVEEDYLRQHKDAPGQIDATLLYKMMYAYYLGNYGLAAKLSHRLRGFEKQLPANFTGIRFIFFEGLTALEMLHSSKGSQISKRKWQKQKSSSIKKMVMFLKKGNVNVHHMLLLLEAEEYALKKNTDITQGRYKYDEAISKATRAGFANDQALGNERAGMFCLKRGDLRWASTYIARAHERWSEYGALALCQKLEDRYPELITADVRRRSNRAYENARKVTKRASIGKKSVIFVDRSDSWAKKTTTTLSKASPLDQSRASQSTIATNGSVLSTFQSFGSSTIQELG